MKQITLHSKSLANYTNQQLASDLELSCNFLEETIDEIATRKRNRKTRIRARQRLVQLLGKVLEDSNNDQV